MRAAVASGVFPGAVLFVRLQGRVVHHRAYGHAALLPHPVPASPETIYDLASLTKPLATTTAIVGLVGAQRLSLDDPVEHRLEELRGAPVGRATVAQLLNHSSGLPAWRPFYERVAEEDRMTPGFLGSPRARDLVLQAIGKEALPSEPGAHSLYSDLGFMLLGFLVERTAGCPAPDYCREQIYRPLHAEPLFYVGPNRQPVWGTVPLDRVAPTEQDPWRGRLLRGEVHDENAYALGGIAGHSGLFGTAAAVAAVAGEWLKACHDRSSVLPTELVRRFVRCDERTPGSSWALGWDTPSAPSSSGTKFSPRSFGHLGFTGTSVWIDPERELEVVLLSNRVHPTRRNDAIRRFRPAIHDLIYEECVEGN
jgi:CubicO group peptidase (beta-lactamase class C family)